MIRLPVLTQGHGGDHLGSSCFLPIVCLRLKLTKADKVDCFLGTLDFDPSALAQARFFASRLQVEIVPWLHFAHS